MPILWRYLLVQFFRVLILCVCAFITVLMTTRLGEIAHFVTLGPEKTMIFQFIFLQIPFMLPIAIPVSCLISSILLVQKLSSSHELTAFRSCGFSIRHVLTPLLLAAAFLSLFNFYLVSELATQSHFMTNRLKKEMRNINPLLLLSNRCVMRMKGGYYETLGASKIGEKAVEAILALPDERSKRINLVLAKELKAKEHVLEGNDITLITANETREKETFDDVVIENIGKFTSGLNDIATFMQDTVFKLNHDHLKFSMLLVRLEKEKRLLELGQNEKRSPEEIKKRKKNIVSMYSEMVRRFSSGLVVFSFTLLGLAFGIKIGRRQSNLGLFISLTLAAGYLACYFSAKGLENHLFAASMLYLIPHSLMITLSIYMLSRISKGLES